MASVATPNLTELCLLTGADYAAVCGAPDRRLLVEQMARQLLRSGCQAVVVTGVEALNKSWPEFINVYKQLGGVAE